MRAEQRRKGRRIRKARRIHSQTREAFTRLAEAAGRSAENMQGAFAIFSAAIEREEKP